MSRVNLIHPEAILGTTVQEIIGHVVKYPVNLDESLVERIITLEKFPDAPPLEAAYAPGAGTVELYFSEPYGERPRGLILEQSLDWPEPKVTQFVGFEFEESMAIRDATKLAKKATQDYRCVVSVIRAKNLQRVLHHAYGVKLYQMGFVDTEHATGSKLALVDTGRDGQYLHTDWVRIKRCALDGVDKEYTVAPFNALQVAAVALGGDAIICYDPQTNTGTPVRFITGSQGGGSR